MGYRNRTSSKHSGSFSHRSEIATTSLSCAMRGGRWACFVTVHDARMGRSPWEGRKATANRRPRHVRQRTGPSCQDASTTTTSARSDRVYRLRSTFSCCRRRARRVIAARWRPPWEALEHEHGMPLHFRPVFPGGRSWLRPRKHRTLVGAHCWLLHRPVYLIVARGVVLFHLSPVSK